MSGKGKTKNNVRFNWLTAWAVTWPIFALLAMLLTGFRIVMTSEIVSMLETEDIPMFAFFEDHLPILASLVTICSAMCLLSCALLYRRLGTSWRGLCLWASIAICGLLSGCDAIWALTDQAEFATTKPVSPWDWLRVLAFPLAGGFYLTLTGRCQTVRHWRYLLLLLRKNARSHIPHSIPATKRKGDPMPRR